MGITFITEAQELVKNARFVVSEVAPHHPRGPVPAIVVPLLDSQHNKTRTVVYGVTMVDFYNEAHRSSNKPNLVSYQQPRFQNVFATLGL